MKSVIFEKTGLDNLEVKDIPRPSVSSHDVLVRVKMIGVNPIDYFVVSGTRKAKPMPHVPGAEFAGVVDDVGNHVTRLRKGDRIVIYGRVFDDSCNMCLSGNEMLCRNGGIVGVATNGGYAEYVLVPERNAFKIPDDLSWELAASLPVAALTPYHALAEAQIKTNQCLVVFGASGNTGMFAVQYGRKSGAKVIAVTRKTWPKDFGTEYVVGHGEAFKQIERITKGKMADCVLNSLGSETWSQAFETVGVHGTLVFFGTLTGAKTELDLATIYNKHIRIIGTTGGTRKEMQELIDTARTLKLRVWKKFKLEEAAIALKSLLSKERDGRILLEL
jgi:NADPH:quinone reductase-like Zn-dependent oxidoreductase